MTVSISKMSIDYYLSTAAGGDGAVIGNARDLTSYYTESEDPPGTWFGSGLAGLSLVDGQQVEKWDAKTLYEDMKDPGTGLPIGRPPIKEQQTPEGAKTPKGEQAKDTRKPVHGFDLTFSAPKSVSTLWAMADPELQGRIRQAHKDAIADTLAWAEKNVIQTRAGHGGVAHVSVTGLVGSLFDHSDSREGDPQLHTHAVIHNRVQRTTDGQWTTIDSYTLHRHVVAISERYNSLLFDRLYQAAGAVAEVRDDSISLTTGDIDQALVTHNNTVNDMAYEPYNARIELTGIPDDLIEEFSTRSRMIEERTNQLLDQWREGTGKADPPRHILHRLRQQATLETRQPKDTNAPVSLSEKMVGWRDRAENLHYDPANLVADSIGHDTPLVTADLLDDATIAKLGHWVLTDTGMRRTTFTRANLLASTERILRTVRCRNATDREQLAERIVTAATAQAVDLTPDRTANPRLGLDPAITHRGHSILEHKHHAGLYTTHQVMDDEAFMMERISNPAAGYTDTELGDKIHHMLTKEGHTLSSDQAAATHQVLTSGQAVDAIIGPAGTGKTTTMKAIRDLWTEKYGESSVLGLAPSAVAAGVLGDEIEASTDNTAKWLYESAGDGAARRVARMQRHENELNALQQRLPRSTGQHRSRLVTQVDALSTKLAADYAAHAKYTMRKDQLVIIDEASMVGTSTLAELNRQADQSGAKILLVGDPRQLDAIDAGGFLGWMERETDAAKLNQVWRFRDTGTAPSPDHWEAKASLKLREGDEEVLKTYEEAERLIGEPGQDASDTAYKAWIADTLDGSESLMIGATNEQVQDMNTRAQLDLVDHGHVDLSTIVTLRNEAEAGIGDVVLARKNNRNLRDENGAFIANGVRIRITEINDDGSAIGHRTDNDAKISLTADYLEASVELGYASTAHRAQGVTVDTCHTIAQSGIPRELFYVAMTRGKHGNYAYVDIPEDQEDTPDKWNIMRKIQPDQKLAVLKGILRNETNTKTAHETEMAEHGWAKDYGRMAHEAVYLADVARTTRTIDWVTENYGPEHLRTLQETEDWATLVRSDPAVTISDAPETEEPAIAELLLHSGSSPATPLTAGLVQDYDPATVEQSDLKDDLTQRMDARLDEMSALVMDSDEEWVQQVRAQHPDNEFEAVRLYCAWRSVSDQDDAVTPAGKIPDRAGERYMHEFYLRFQTALKSLEQEKNAPSPESERTPATEPATQSPLENDSIATKDDPWAETPSDDYWDALFAEEPPIHDEPFDALGPIHWDETSPAPIQESDTAPHSQRPANEPHWSGPDVSNDPGITR